MADVLQPVHPLAARLEALAELPAGLTVEVDPFLTMTSLRYRPGGPAEDGVRAALGVVPPAGANTWVSGPVGEVIWLGPDEWLVVSPLAVLAGQESGLRAVVVPHGGAAVDVSGQRVRLTLRGRQVHDVLAKGCALDLHPSVFPAGSSAQTTLGLAGVILLAGSQTEEFVVFVRQSFAGYLADWLVDAMAEFRAT